MTRQKNNSKSMDYTMPVLFKKLFKGLSASNVQGRVLIWSNSMQWIPGFALDISGLQGGIQYHEFLQKTK